MCGNCGHLKKDHPIEIGIKFVVKSCLVNSGLPLSSTTIQNTFMGCINSSKAVTIMGA